MNEKTETRATRVARERKRKAKSDFIYTLCSLLTVLQGLLFSAFAQLTSSGVPIVGTLFSGGFAAVFAFLFTLNDLTEMISIGTLMAFTVVCGGVLVLRYQVRLHTAPR